MAKSFRFGEDYGGRPDYESGRPDFSKIMGRPDFSKMGRPKAYANIKPGAREGSRLQGLYRRGRQSLPLIPRGVSGLRIGHPGERGGNFPMDSNVFREAGFGYADDRKKTQRSMIDDFIRSMLLGR